MKKNPLFLFVIILLFTATFFTACNNEPTSELPPTDIVLTELDIYEVAIRDATDSFLANQRAELEAIKEFANTPNVSCAQVAERTDALLQENQRVQNVISNLNQRNATAAELAAQANFDCQESNQSEICPILNLAIAPKPGGCNVGNCITILDRTSFLLFPAEKEEIKLAILDNLGKPLTPEIILIRNAGEPFAIATMNLSGIPDNTGGRLRLESNFHPTIETNVVINSRNK